MKKLLLYIQVYYQKKITYGTLVCNIVHKCNLFPNSALLKRSIGYIEIKKYDEALDDLEYVNKNLLISFKYFKGFAK